MNDKKCPDLHERAKRIHEPGRVCRELLYLRSKRVSRQVLQVIAHGFIKTPYPAQAKREVPAFTYQALQKGTVVKPPTK